MSNNVVREDEYKNYLWLRVMMIPMFVIIY